MLDWLRKRFFQKDLELSIIGLQEAGKSTLINSLQNGTFLEDTIPTVGVSIREVKKGNVTLKIYDLGGQRRYRESWEKYCANSDCIVFVLDSADRENIDIAKNNLEHLLSWDTLAEIPLLVLGNKNDLPNCFTEREIIDKMGL